MSVQVSIDEVVRAGTDEQVPIRLAQAGDGSAFLFVGVTEAPLHLKPADVHALITGLELVTAGFEGTEESEEG